MDFETAAIRTKEDRIHLFRRECMLASVAVANNAAAWLAHLWGSDASIQQVNRRALIWDTFPLEHIQPDIALSLYGGTLEAAKGEDGIPDADEAMAWLALALENGWSRRDLLDEADILKGKHLSRYLFTGEVEMTEWDVPTGRVAFEGLPISGEMPKRARATVREVLALRE